MTKPFDSTKPYCRRDGGPVRIICTDAKGPRPLIVLYSNATDSEGVYRLYVDGTEWGPGLGQQSKFDLINIPEKIEGWINIYKAYHGLYRTGIIYSTQEEAVAKADDDVFACIKVSFTAGEGLHD